MQSLGRRYVQHANCLYRRSGRLCIELNPVKAGMVCMGRLRSTVKMAKNHRQYAVGGQRELKNGVVLHLL